MSNNGKVVVMPAMRGPDPYVEYERRKREWSQRHPDASPAEYQRAMTRIAREVGV